MRRLVQCRAEGTSIAGTLLRYDDTADLGGGIKERFLPGSVRWESVGLNLQHDRSKPVARTPDSLEISDDGEQITLRAEPVGPYADEALQLVRAGLLTGLSVEFMPARQRWDGNTLVIAEAELVGAGLVDRAAYPESSASVRHRTGEAFSSVRLRGPGLTGEIQLGATGLVSGANQTYLEVEPGALEAVDDVFVLRGFSYDNPIASTGSGSAEVEVTKDAVRFTVPRLRSSIPAAKEARALARAGLLQGAVPGIMRQESETEKQDDGSTIERIRKGLLCEINLTGRVGLGPIKAGRRAQPATAWWA